MQYQQVNKYLETNINTASPAQLLIMLVDGAIRFCRQGIEGIKEKNYTEANRQLMKVQDIVKEFMITLDPNSPLSGNLQRLYEYFNYLLIESNTKKKTEPAEEVLGYLKELKETWLLAAQQAAKTAVR